MHPILATRVRILLYLAGWIPMLALLDYVLWTSGGVSWMDGAAVLAPACAVFAFACLSPWPLCRVRPLRLPPLPRSRSPGRSRRRRVGHVRRRRLALRADAGPPRPLHLDLLFGMGMHPLPALRRPALCRARRRASRAATLSAAEARSLARDAELHALRMQINPHFLFNSLHSIAALATQDGARAREMCIRLSRFSAQQPGPRRSRKHSAPRRTRPGAQLSGCGAGPLRRPPACVEEIQDACEECSHPRADPAAAGGERRQARYRRPGGGRCHPAGREPQRR